MILTLTDKIRQFQVGCEGYELETMQYTNLHLYRLTFVYKVVTASMYNLYKEILVQLSSDLSLTSTVPDTRNALHHMCGVNY